MQNLVNAPKVGKILVTSFPEPNFEFCQTKGNVE